MDTLNNASLKCNEPSTLTQEFREKYKMMNLLSKLKHSLNSTLIRNEWWIQLCSLN